MNWHEIALGTAGLIGGCTAVFHGVLVQRLMVQPINAALLNVRTTSGTVRRLVPLLLHLSTISWFLGGVVLLLVASLGDANAQLSTGIFVGSLYLFGAVANAWGSKGRHPGWMLMAAAVILIAIGISA